MAMPEHARISRDLWLDPTFTALPHTAQYLYLVLLTQPAVQDTGIIRWNAETFAGFSRGSTPESVEAAGVALREAGLLIPNESTGTVMLLDPIEGCNVSQIGYDDNER